MKSLRRMGSDAAARAVADRRGCRRRTARRSAPTSPRRQRPRRHARPRARRRLVDPARRRRAPLELGDAGHALAAGAPRQAARRRRGPRPASPDSSIGTRDLLAATVRLVSARMSSRIMAWARFCAAARARPSRRRCRAPRRPWRRPRAGRRLPATTSAAAAVMSAAMRLAPRRHAGLSRTGSRSAPARRPSPATGASRQAEVGRS